MRKPPMKKNNDEKNYCLFFLIPCIVDGATKKVTVTTLQPTIEVGMKYHLGFIN